MLNRKALATSYNTAYTAHSVRSNFGFAETSYMLGTLSAICTKQYDKKLGKPI